MALQVRDTTGRFATRPHFAQEELDAECEDTIRNFLCDLHGKVIYPVSTDDLTKLIERDADDLDLYADLSHLGEDVEGITEFVPGEKPRVKISRFLSEDPRLENRLRTTLTHEYGHVHFHTYLWELQEAQTSLFVPSIGTSEPVTCKRDNIIAAGKTDWMEWQAGYVCGSILMPETPLRRLVNEYYRLNNIITPVLPDSLQGRALIEAVVARFKVSNDAAKVRLCQLQFLGRIGSGPSLWG